MKLLKKLCSIHAPSGEENNISEFIIEYVNSNMQNWKVKPKIYSGDGFQDSIILSFGILELLYMLIWIALVLQ